MPYVEIWVDEQGPTKKQIRHIAELVQVAFDAAANRSVPDFIRDKLDNAATAVFKEFDLEHLPTDIPKYPIDKKYLDWREERDRGAST